MKTTELTQKQFCAQSSISPALIRAVVRQMGGWESFTQSAPDISYHGIDGGFNGFIYYADTEAFAKCNHDAISELASAQAQEIGYDSTFAMIRGFGCFNGDTLSDGDLMRALCRGQNPKGGPNILNGLAWYAGEEVSRDYCLNRTRLNLFLHLPPCQRSGCESTRGSYNLTEMNMEKLTELKQMIAGALQFQDPKTRTKALKACQWRLRGPNGEHVGVGSPAGGLPCCFVPESSALIFDGRDNENVKLATFEKALGSLTVEIIPQITCAS